MIIPAISSYLKHWEPTLTLWKITKKEEEILQNYHQNISTLLPFFWASELLKHSDGVCTLSITVKI